MQVIQNISMDFTVHGITPKIYGKQDDSGSMRAVAISLYSGGEAYPLTKNTGFMLRYKTAAGAIGLYDVLPDGSSAFSVDGNTVTVSLVDQIFAMPGNVECELRVIEPETVVYSGDTVTQTSGTISTWTWIVEVERSNVGDATIPSDYINVLSGYAATAVQAAAEAKESASSIDASTLMKLSDYDASGIVKEAGGIAAYVQANAPKVNVVNSVNSSSTTDAASAASVKKAYDKAESVELKTDGIAGSTLSASFAYSITTNSQHTTHKVYGKLHAIHFSLSGIATSDVDTRYIMVEITGLDISMSLHPVISSARVIAELPDGNASLTCASSPTLSVSGGKMLLSISTISSETVQSGNEISVSGSVIVVYD